MRRFSPNQLEFPLDQPPFPSETGGASSGAFEIGAEDDHDIGSSTTGMEFPDFGGPAATRAETARMAGRIVASQVSETEYQALLAERQSLIDRLLAKTITRREEIRLEYVRWSLDRIDDARHGSDLDRIEDSISRYEHFLGNLDQFKVALETAIRRKK